MLIARPTGELTNATPRTAHNYWANARQTLSLLHRAEVPESTIDAIRSEYSDSLVSSILIYPQTLQLLGLDPELSFRETKEALGLSTEPQEYTAPEKAFLKKMKDSQLELRRTNWKWRISQEVEEKQRDKWYPFFVTLTLDPRKVELKKGMTTEEFWRDGYEFRMWIRELCKVVTDELGHPEARKKTKDFGYRPESDYVQYVGVIEHGKSREHHHAHFLVWMKEIPSAWKICPNAHINDPTKRIERECREMSAIWTWSSPHPQTGRSLSPAHYFRIKGDIWSNLENPHCVPIDKKTNKPVFLGGPRQAAAYVTKYIQKDRKEWKHRVKATRNLGMKTLKKTIQELPLKNVEALTWRPETYRQHHLVSLTHSVPLGLIRLVAKQEEFSRKLEQNRLDFQSLMITNSGSYNRMLRSVRRGARPDRMPLGQFYDWLCQHLPVQKGYSEVDQILSHEMLSKTFPRTKIYVQPESLGGNYERT
jgi:hypothetical protein